MALLRSNCRYRESSRDKDYVHGQAEGRRTQDSQQAGRCRRCGERRRDPPDGERRYAGTDHPAGHPRRRRPELAQGRRPRPDAAGRLPLPGEDLPLRPRAHPRAGRPRPRLRGPRLLRELRAARRRHPGRPLPAQGREDPRLRPLLDRRRQQGLARPRPRRPRLRREVLHQAGELGPRRQQHPRLLHPGRDQVPRPDPRRQAGAGPRLPAGRRPPTTTSGTSSRSRPRACT